MLCPIHSPDIRTGKPIDSFYHSNDQSPIELNWMVLRGNYVDNQGWYSRMSISLSMNNWNSICLHIPQPRNDWIIAEFLNHCDRKTMNEKMFKSSRPQRQIAIVRIKIVWVYVVHTMQHNNWWWIVSWFSVHHCVSQFWHCEIFVFCCCWDVGIGDVLAKWSFLFGFIFAYLLTENLIDKPLYCKMKNSLLFRTNAPKE